MLANVAELGPAAWRNVGTVGCRDAAIVTGIGTDKMLALTGQSPVAVQIANIRMPTPEEREERRQRIPRLMRSRACSRSQGHWTRRKNS